MQVEALVDLPNIDPREVAVELYAGPITATGEIGTPKILRMEYSKQIAGARHVFSGVIECRVSGRQGFGRPADR